MRSNLATKIFGDTISKQRYRLKQADFAPTLLGQG
jgi:hypothetical protein